MGWASTGCWLLGWYPQVAHNFVRRSAAGVSLAYMAWNALGFFVSFEGERYEIRERAAGREEREARNNLPLSGARRPFLPPPARHGAFLAAPTSNALPLPSLSIPPPPLQCYSIFTASLYWSPAVRAEYRAAHGGADSDVRSNDVFFALHALVMTLVVAAQAAAYGTGGQTLSVTAAAALGGAVTGIAVYARLWEAGSCGCVSALALLNALAAVKVGTTAVKYAPQVALHYRTGSTAGFSSANALTDLAGGALSLGQQALDAWLFRDASIITGDMPKLGLSLLSMIYSCILIGQHWAYSGRGGGGSAAGGGEEEGEGDGDGRGAPFLG